MSRGLAFSLTGLLVLGALAGCARSFLYMEEREPWRREAEVKCLKSGVIKEGPTITRVTPIDGPGICGADFPLKVAALGDSPLMAFADDLRPPGAIPMRGAQPRWPVSQSVQPQAEVYAPPPPAYPAKRASDAYQPPAGSETYLRPPDQPQPRYAAPRYEAPQYEPPPSRARHVAPGEPISLNAPGITDLIEADARSSSPGTSVVRSYPPDRGAYQPPRSYPAERPYAAPPSSPMQRPAARPELPKLGPTSAPQYTGSVEVKPTATLACPIVSALDQWIAGSMQPAAMRWFGQPVTEIKQISAYSCRGMNGQPGARISEHAFGNAFDIAAFTLADGRKIVVRTAWNGAPEEQGFLRDIQSAACDRFNTVLAPGSNRFHSDHIHLDLMRRSGGHTICNPEAMSGEVAAARAAQRKGYARKGNTDFTGSIKKPKSNSDAEGDDDHELLPAEQAEPQPRPARWPWERFRD